MLVASAVMSLVAVVLGGLVAAVDTARKHVDGLQTASAQGRFVTARIRNAMSRAGTYRIGSGATVPGVAVISNNDRPEVLVVWTGGRNSSLADQRPRDALPKANELLIFTPDPNAENLLVELMVSSTTEVDLMDPDLATVIRQFIDSSTAEKVQLCDRLRLVEESGVPVGLVRFEREAFPTDAQLAATAAGSAEWRDLPWAGGVSTSSAGLRQILIRLEVQIVSHGRQAGTTAAPSLPVFGAATFVYEHFKG